MTDRSIEARVRSVIASRLGCPEGELQEGARIKSTSGWDSLAHVQLMLALEEEFGVLLDAETIMRLTSLDSIVRYFRAAPPEEAAASATRRAEDPPATRDAPTLEGFATALKTALGELGIEASDLLLVHSFLGTLRTVSSDWPAVCEMLVETLRQAIGPEGTLVMPTFTGAFTRTGRFDRAQTPSETGVLTEYFRNRAGVRHSMHPVHRFSALGPHADEITGSDCRSAFGPGSPLHVMHRLGGKILFFSVDWECCTFFHYVEEQYEVSYRYYKDMTGTIITPEGARRETWQEFAGDWGYGVEEPFNAFGRRVEAAGLCRMAWAGPAMLRSCRMDELFEFTYAQLERNLKCLIKI